MAFKLGVPGIDHGHIFGKLSHMQAQGCMCDGYWIDCSAVTEAKFCETFPTLEKHSDRRRLLDEPANAKILSSAGPTGRAAHAIKVMEAGKDVMADKTG